MPEPASAAAVRPATTEDLAVLVAIERASFGGEAWSEGLLAGELGSADRVVLVHEGAVVDAYGTVGVVGDVADLHRIATLPDARGRGVAAMLLAALLDAARDRGAARMLLEVADSNTPARRLYERAGFTTIATRRRYYPSGADALVMELAL